MNEVQDEFLSLSAPIKHSTMAFAMQCTERVVTILPRVSNDLLPVEPGLPGTGLLPLETLDPIPNALKAASGVGVSKYVERLVSILVEHVLHDARTLPRPLELFPHLPAIQFEFRDVVRDVQRLSNHRVVEIISLCHSKDLLKFLSIIVI